MAVNGSTNGPGPRTWREFWQRWYAARIADAHGERWGADVVARARALRKGHGLDSY